MGSHAARERSLSHFPLSNMQTSQELPSKQSLCVITQSTLYSGSSLVMALTRRHTGGQDGESSDRRDRSKISDRLGAITLGTQALRVVALAHHRKENKATYVAQEATKEGDSRTPRDPGMNAAPQSTKTLQSKQPNMQRSQRSRVGGPGDAKTHFDSSDAHKELQKDDICDTSTQRVVENLTSKGETVDQDTTFFSELTTDHTGARSAPEATTAGMQQDMQQLSVERSSLQVVEISISKGETVDQDTTFSSELTTDHTGARSAPEATTAGMQQDMQQLSVERSSLQVVEISISKGETVDQDTTFSSELTTDHTGARSAPEATTAGMQQDMQQLSVERSSLQVVEISISKGETVDQDTTFSSELTTDHTGSRGDLEVTATGIQHTTSGERKTDASCR